MSSIDRPDKPDATVTAALRLRGALRLCAKQSLDKENGFRAKPQKSAKPQRVRGLCNMHLNVLRTLPKTDDETDLHLLLSTQCVKF
jgi:hypothetical protein